MWISKLELTNFKSYQHQVFDFPAPEDGRNIVLVGGMNGFGKTSLLEALYLGLYGKEAITHLARAGLKSETGYPSFLERALHGQASRNGREIMSVMVQISINGHEAFQFLRKWFFTKSGEWTNGNEELVVYEVRAGIRQPHRSGGTNAEELLDKHFIPAHLAPFFFFDGEEVKKLADQSRVEQIKQGMEGLLGVVLLRKLGKRLEQFQANRSQGVSTVDEEKHRLLLEQLTVHEAQLQNDTQRRYDLEGELDGLKAHREKLMSRIFALGGGGGDVATASQIIAEQKDAESELNKVMDQLDSILSEKLPFHFVSQELRGELVSQLHAELEKIRWDEHKRSMEPGKARFMSRFIDGEPAIHPALTEPQQQVIGMRLEAAWESLFYPPPEGCAEEIIHDYLYGGKREQVIDLMGNLKVGVKDILSLLERQATLQRRREELVGRYARIEGVERDGTLAKLNGELTAVNALISERDREWADLNRAIKSLEQDILNKRATYEREHEKFIQANPVKSVVAKAQRVCELINELIPSLYSLKTRELGHAMTDVYLSLAHKDQVARIDIDEIGQTKVLSKEGDEIVFDRSAGENQLFATALIAGLAKVSGMDAPLVVDTPLGRLDSKHREKILDFWVSDVSRQVILLSQDKEIDMEMYRHIEPHIAKTYVLHHQQIANGVGKTWAEENAYFGVEA